VENHDGPTGAPIAYAAILVLIYLGIFSPLIYQRWIKAERPQVPIAEKIAMSQCEISFYTKPEHGKRTASGEIFDSLEMTFATQIDSIEFGDLVLFVAGNDSAVGRCTDHMPPSLKYVFPDRLFDVSGKMFETLGFKKKRGTAKVRWRRWR
jgi:hypothetical protein